MRLAPIVLLAVLAHAPMQCARDPDPALRKEETPPEALYGLASQFKTQGDERAWRTTLEYLMSHYPSSRYATTARADLAAASPASGAPPSASAAP